MVEYKFWVESAGKLFLLDKQKEGPKLLDVGVYELGFHEKLGFYLTHLSTGYTFDYKIYGLETKLVDRVVKYYDSTQSGNLGILLNGIKGTGKTVTGKVISNKLNLPVIIVPQAYKESEDYLNSIPQDIIVFVDEYEKIFKDSSEFLTIMDGALNSINRRVFILTTNNLYVDKNLLDRTGRVRYLKTFGGLSPEQMEEIIDDILIYKDFRDECIKYLSTLEIITVDLVKAVVQEININNESPNEFKHVFNASIKRGKYRIFLPDAHSTTEAFLTRMEIMPRPDFGGNTLNARLYFNNIYVGIVTDVVDYKTIKVRVRDYKAHSEKVEEQNQFNLPKGEVSMVIEDDYMYNDSYRYGNKYHDGVDVGD